MRTARGERPIPPRATSSLPAAPSPTSSDGWWQPAGEPTTLASGLAAPWSVVPLADGWRAHLAARQRHGPRAHRRRRRLRTSESCPASSPAANRACTASPSGRTRTASAWLYAYHGAADDNRVVRMPLSGDAGGARARRCGVVFAGIPRSRTHNGGPHRLRTGRPAVRDDGRCAEPGCRSGSGRARRQDPATHTARAMPAPGNPFGNAVWTLGHRNVQGIAWTSDGDDVGERVRPGHVGRAQSHRRRGELRLADRRGRGGRWTASPTPSWRGRRTRRARAASPRSATRCSSPVCAASGCGSSTSTASSTLERDAAVGMDEQGRLRDVVAAPDGTLWVLTNNTDGRGTPRAGGRRAHATADRAGRLSVRERSRAAGPAAHPARYGENRELPAAVPALPPLPLSRHAGVSELRGRTRLPHAHPPVLRPAQRPGRDRRAARGTPARTATGSATGSCGRTHRPVGASRAASPARAPPRTTRWHSRSSPRPRRPSAGSLLQLGEPRPARSCRWDVEPGGLGFDLLSSLTDGTPGDDRPRERHHHDRPRREPRRPPRGAAGQARRAVPHDARATSATRSVTTTRTSC